MKKQLIGLGVAALMFGGIGSALATPVYYSNDQVLARADFQTAAAGTTLAAESFENIFPDSNSLTFFSGSLDEFTISISVGLMRQSSFSRAVSDGNYSLGFNELPSSTITFSFVNSINYFGIDVNDMNFGTMSFLDDLGNTSLNHLVGDHQSSAGGPGYQNLQFFGVSNSDSFNTVQLSFANTGGTGLLTLDGLQFDAHAGAPVPEPATMLLFGTGLAGLVGSRIRKKKQQ